MASQEGSNDEAKLYSAAAVAGGVVVGGYFSGTWNGVTSLGGFDFAVVKLSSDGTVAWRRQVRSDSLSERLP